MAERFGDSHLPSPEASGVTRRRALQLTAAAVGSLVAFDAASGVAAAQPSPHNIESFRQPHRYTWHGQALAVLAPAQHPGRLTLTASASGLRAARIALPVL